MVFIVNMVSMFYTMRFLLKSRIALVCLGIYHIPYHTIPYHTISSYLINKILICSVLSYRIKFKLSVIIITNISFFTEYIYPIENFNVQPLAAQKFAENISLVWDLEEGSYTSVEVYYNEILCCNETNLHRVGGHM
jgi:hypothetical protein